MALVSFCLRDFFPAHKLWNFEPLTNKQTNTSFRYSGQILTFHQPRFPWNKATSLTKTHQFGVFGRVLGRYIDYYSHCRIAKKSGYVGYLSSRPRPLFPGNPSEAGPPWSGFVSVAPGMRRSSTPPTTPTQHPNKFDRKWEIYIIYYVYTSVSIKDLRLYCTVQ